MVFQDEFHGCLFNQFKTCWDVLTTKYLRFNISYQGTDPYDTLPVDEGALKEVLLNALIHKDYGVPTPVQIRVFADRLEIVNCGAFPENNTVESLLLSRESRPRNPHIANAFLKAGVMPTWGGGIKRIVNGCSQKPGSSVKFKEEAGAFRVILHYAKSVK